MTDAVLIGRILPERQHFSVNGQRLSIKMPDRGVDAWLLFGVVDNQLTAKFTGQLGDLSNYMLKSIASQAVPRSTERRCVDDGVPFRARPSGSVARRQAQG
jgi:hypothetical protein